MDVCEDCELAKARRKNLMKYNTNPEKEVGERLYIDISWIEHPSRGNRQYWFLMVDEVSKMFWSRFLHEKSESSDEVIKLVNQLTVLKINVKYIRCDNSGENQSLPYLLIENKHPMRV